MRKRVENFLWGLVIVAIFAIAATDPIIYDWLANFLMEVFG